MASHFPPSSDNVGDLALHGYIEEALFRTDVGEADDEILPRLTKEMDGRRDVTQQLESVVNTRRYGVRYPAKYGTIQVDWMDSERTLRGMFQGKCNHPLCP